MRIALATVGTTGDVRPFLSLAERLARAGHAVRAVSWELYRPAFEARGIGFTAAGPATTAEDIAAAAERAAAERSPLAQVAVLRDFHLRDALEHHRALREALAGHELVVLHGIHSLAEAAVRDIGARWATAVFDPVLLPTATAPPAGMPNLGPLNRLGWWMLNRMLSGQDAPLREALRAASPSVDAIRLFRARSPLLHLVACSPHLAVVPGDLSPATHFTGAWTDASPPAPLPERVAAFLHAGAPPVAVTFGSMAVEDRDTLADTVASALRAAGRRGVVQGLAPAGDDLLAAGELDHRALFPRVVAVVHHGGAGTTHAAARAGVPQVVVPHVGDQRYWADRVRRLGIGPVPVPVDRLTPDVLAERIRTATQDHGMRARAMDLAAAMTDEDGAASAVRLLEETAEA
ncbi:MAG TPA: glycosyltransferase [Candidatus Limnocylindria bacterium]